MIGHRVCPTASLLGDIIGATGAILYHDTLPASDVDDWLVGALGANSSDHFS
jgi:hypothetical protein